MLTNAHVVEECSEASVETRLGSMRALVVHRDKTNDLALLKSPRGVSPLSVRSGARLGEPIAAFGFPLAGVLSKLGNFTVGNITALDGLGDDNRYLQISALFNPATPAGHFLTRRATL